jgi:glycyl-tRNA synthetase alpha chain
MYIQGVDSVYDIIWARGDDGVAFTYGDVYLENEREFSTYNFEIGNTDFLFGAFDRYEKEAQACLDAQVPLPAYDWVLKCCHTFNLLDCPGCHIRQPERMAYILRVRTMVKACCASYLKNVIGQQPCMNEGEEN